MGSYVHTRLYGCLIYVGGQLELWVEEDRDDRNTFAVVVIMTELRILLNMLWKL